MVKKDSKKNNSVKEKVEWKSARVIKSQYWDYSFDKENFVYRIIKIGDETVLQVLETDTSRLITIPWAHVKYISEKYSKETDVM